MTVLRADMGAEQGAEDGVYKVCGLRLKFEESGEGSVVGVADHPTVREEEYAMEEGEYIVEVTTHHLRSVLTVETLNTSKKLAKLELQALREAFK